eukprot:CAMPEP_0115743740 /NCGR_PEP_ID=MMETSP0272-20121206/91232_1 /TAXON_ID=71861 /ORGANISM="Scrippsiella trochoidea, Strain CCMP3099" /LENGTH=108 /DNA_ID=CAMNT_0003188569 /DNA_START=191 /DNA_END=517 /DNA_ORIENTATION=-
MTSLNISRREASVGRKTTSSPTWKAEPSTASSTPYVKSKPVGNIRRGYSNFGREFPCEAHEVKHDRGSTNRTGVHVTQAGEALYPALRRTRAASATLHQCQLIPWAHT